MTKAEKVHKAIDLAIEPGACRYKTDDGQPSCFVAQLVALEGGDINELEEGRRVDSTGNENHPALKDYDIIRLADIQQVWDTRNDWTAEDKRQTMHPMVKNYFDD